MRACYTRTEERHTPTPPKVHIIMDHAAAAICGANPVAYATGMVNRFDFCATCTGKLPGLSAAQLHCAGIDEHLKETHYERSGHVRQARAARKARYALFRRRANAGRRDASNGAAPSDAGRGPADA